MGGWIRQFAPVFGCGQRRDDQTMLHPSLAISPTLVAIALVCGAAAQAAEQASAPGEPTACRVRLSADRAVFKPLSDLAGDPNGPAGCGGTDAVLLQRIILDDHTQVAVEPPATLRCEMAEAIADFVRSDLAPAAAAMGSPLTSVHNYDSYSCRGRNRVVGAKLSQHGLANALDIRSVRLKDGRTVLLADADAPYMFRAAMKTAACERFTTVLGPGSDGYHEDHIHLDRIERRSGYRMCRWEVRDEPRFALQSVSNRSSALPALTPAVEGVEKSAARSASAAFRAPIPLPRPRPFKAAGAPAVIQPAESPTDEAQQPCGP
jgi:hypothetical protein